jgi:hypothetical protein
VALLDLDVVFRIATWILVSWDSTVLLEPNDLCHTMYHNSIVLLPYYVTRSKISRVGTAFMCHTTIVTKLQGLAMLCERIYPKCLMKPYKYIKVYIVCQGGTEPVIFPT